MLAAARPRLPKQLVFVYGSLLRGLHNHHLLCTARLACSPARTAAPGFVLVDSSNGYPFALAAGRARASDAQTVLLGEVYEVDDRTLAQLDALEGHPDWYRRSLQPIEGEDPAWIYLMEDEATLALSVAYTTYRRALTLLRSMSLWSANRWLS